MALPREDQRTPVLGGHREQRRQMVDRALLAAGELLGATAQLHHVRARLRRSCGCVVAGLGIHGLDHAIHALGKRVGDARRLRLLDGHTPGLHQLLGRPCSAGVRVGQPPPLLIEALGATVVGRLGLVGVLGGPPSLLGGALELASAAGLGTFA